MRTLWDSVTAADIPADAGMVGGYVDGAYRWSDADWRRFPHAVKVRIAVFPDTDDGHVLDVERGNATPAQAPGWVKLRRRAGADPTVYCARSAWSQIASQFHAQGVPEPHWWVADWTGAPHVPVGAIACQYADPPLTGHHYDLSEVAVHWPGVDPPLPVPPPSPPPRPPVPPPPPKPPAPPTVTRKDRSMIIVEVDQATLPAGVEWPGVCTFDGSTLTHIVGTPHDQLWTDLLKAVGQTETVKIPYAQYQAWRGQ